jgi:isopentenyl-diphosphate delta-isomerase
MTISKRKKEHVEIALTRDVAFRNKTSGFEHYEFIHCALPEMAFDEADSGVEFLGKRLSFPLMITAMTGGYAGAVLINRGLAEVCQKEKIALGVGSQRQIFENDLHHETFRIVRKTAPDVPVVGNVGAGQIVRPESFGAVRRMAEMVEADAMAVHLNPLQELLQPEGSADFRNVLAAIEKLVRALEIPVIVKEIGCGISEAVAKKLAGAGVKYIDVAGAGGTSWTGIESHRGAKSRMAQAFWDWGIPTAKSIEMAKRADGVRVIASGGIRGGIMMAKAVALGAELCGAALPMLRALRSKEKPGGLAKLVGEWRDEFRAVQFLTSSRTCEDLRREGVLEKTRNGACA